MTAIVGGGSFGTALAVVLARGGEDVRLWVRDPELAQTMEEERENPQYLPGVLLPRRIRVTTEFSEALKGEEIVLHVVPSRASREMARSYAPYLAPGSWIVSATKGVEVGTFKRISEVLQEETGHPVAALSGPNHAEELGAGQPTAAILSHPEREAAERLALRLSTEVFRVYPRRDLVGTEICGAYKNIVGLAAGMVEGLGWGDNCIACLVTLGVDEMTALARCVGADERTVYGLAGIGDLVATATSRYSRNRFWGKELALGTPPAEIERKLRGQVAEGVDAVRSFVEYSKKALLDLPLTEAVAGVVEGKRTVREGVRELLSRV